MLSYCIRCKNILNVLIIKLFKSKNNRFMSRSNCIDCNIIKHSCIKGGSIDIHNKLLPILPKKGLTLPGYN